MKLQSTRKIRFIPPSGEPVVLEPGVPTIVPDAVGTELLAKAGAYLTRLPEHWTDRPHDPTSPIQPGWFIVFRKDGLLTGGPADGDKGKVLKALHHAGDWHFFTHARTIVPGKLVIGVHAVNEHGHPAGAWLVSKHGLDGTGTTKPMTLFPELAPAQRHDMQQRFGLSDGLFDALATGQWSDQLWREFWGRA